MSATTGTATTLDDSAVAALAAATGLCAADVRYWLPRLPEQARADPAERVRRLRAIAALRPPGWWRRMAGAGGGQ